MGAALVFFLVVLAGLPPGLVGLFTKFAAFQAVVDADLGWLAGVMAVNVMIGLAVYLRWVAELFRLPVDEPFSVDVETPAVAVIGTCAGAAVVLSVLPPPCSPWLVDARAGVMGCKSALLEPGAA